MKRVWTSTKVIRAICWFLAQKEVNWMKRVTNPACRGGDEGLCQTRLKLDEVGSYCMSEMLNSFA